MRRKSYTPSTIEWTHVADAMPDNTETLLVIERGEVRAAFCWNGKFRDMAERSVHPTHWAYLPRV